MSYLALDTMKSFSVLTTVVIVVSMCESVMAQWVECDNINSIKGGSCNGPEIPCEPHSGCTNAGKVNNIETCEGLCEQASGCVAVEWHDDTTGSWANVCVLQNQSAWRLQPQGIL